MIVDTIESLNVDFQKAIIDNYKLKDGLYVKIGEKIEFFIYKSPKKDASKETGLIDLNGDIKTSEYDWFAKRDYISVYLNSNKSNRFTVRCL